MPFTDSYMVKPGDNLTEIAMRYGYHNPGPITAYPPNELFFQNRSASDLKANDRFLVPWHPSVLRKLIATSEYLATEIAKDASELIKDRTADREELEHFLFKVDAANFLAGLGTGVIGLAAKGIRGTEMTAEEAMQWFMESRISMASGIATMVIPAPSAPKRDFRFYVRHTLGPWNPSFWASVVVAIKERDVDIYLYGSDATTYKACLRIKKQAESDIERLRFRIGEARRQLGMSFYRCRI